MHPNEWLQGVLLLMLNGFTRLEAEEIMNDYKEAGGETDAV